MTTARPFLRPAAAVLSGVALTAFAWHAVASEVRPAQPQTAEAAPAPTDALTIVWTSADPDVAHRMVLMYAAAAQRQSWFSDVRVIVWGPSQRLVVSDKDVRAAINAMQEQGVEVVACLACADSYGIAGDLRDAGLEVRYMGAPLSDDLKSGRHVLSF
jgi:hypothetical protein